MGRTKKSSAKKTESDSDSPNPNQSVIFLSSSDDEEANKNLSLEIVERAMAKEAKRKRDEGNSVLLVTSNSDDNLKMNFERSDNKKGKKKQKSKKKKEAEEVVGEVIVVASTEEELVRTDGSDITEVNELPDNSVMRKLLRGPRYFDPDEKILSACFNCGEEGHVAMNCTMEKKKRPCYVCGMIGHSSRQCTQGQDCYICKKRGHIAKNCPDKNNRAPQDSIICLRCGDLGHDILSCKNDYAPDDLKEIQCYICKKYGHLCCVDFLDDGPREVFCYNCAQPGHTGLGCAKVRGENRELVDCGPSTLCYKCGEEGHFARGCTKKAKFDRWDAQSSTPRKHAKEYKKRNSLGSQSAPHDYGKTQKKKKKFDYDDDWDMTSSGKSRIKGGWIVDDPSDFSRRKQKFNNWNSPSTHNAQRSHKIYSSNSNGHYSTPRSPFKKHNSFRGTPSSKATKSNYHNGYYNYAPRSYYSTSQDYFY